MEDFSVVEKKIFKAVQYLSSQQENDGSFISFSSPSNSTFKKSIPFHSIFSTSLIIQCLSKYPSNENIKSITSKGIDFLLSQKSNFWTWNYWTRNSPEEKNMTYPDDLDDTFCSLTALYLTDKSTISGDVLASIIQVLTFTEEKVGGPYRTWVVESNAEKIWLDVDIVVNANIGYFLYLHDIRLPNLTKLFRSALENNSFESPYYPTPYPFFLFLSRYLKEKNLKNLLQQCILERVEHCKCNPLDVALSLLSLLNIGASSLEVINKLFQIIISSQKKDGSWPASVFYTGVNPKRDAVFYAGSSALTTAFCVESILKYQDIFKHKHKIITKTQTSNFHDLVSTNVSNYFLKLEENTKTDALVFLRQLLQDDNGKEITSLPELFCMAIGSKSKNISKDFLLKLGEASVFGWIAYTIYDDFLDNEGKVSLLPTANISLRYLTSIYLNILPPKTNFSVLFHIIMNQLEEANAWEVRNTRFVPGNFLTNIPNYNDIAYLANKSLGHALSCIAILIKLGYGIHSTEVVQTVEFFKNFLIARQLNDDAHDWEKDLKLGQINYVAALLLKNTSIKKINAAILQQLREKFWQEAIDDVCDLLEKHTYQAKNILVNSKFLKKKHLLMPLITRQENIIKVTRQEKMKTLEFMRQYSLTKK